MLMPSLWVPSGRLPNGGDDPAPGRPAELAGPAAALPGRRRRSVRLEASLRRSPRAAVFCSRCVDACAAGRRCRAAPSAAERGRGGGARCGGGGLGARRVPGTDSTVPARTRGRLGDAVDALQLGQRHAVLAGDAVERLARLHACGCPPSRLGRDRGGGRGGAGVGVLRPAARGPRAAAPAPRRLGGGHAGRQHQLLARLDGWAVRQAVDLDQRRDRHAVALGDAVERVALLHLDGLAARGGARAVHGRAPASRSAPGAIRLGRSRRWAAGRSRGRSATPSWAGVGAGRRSARTAAACSRGRHRRGRRRAAARRAHRRSRGSRRATDSGGVGSEPGLVALVGQAEEGKVEPRHVGAAATDQNGQRNNHPRARRWTSAKAVQIRLLLNIGHTSYSHVSLTVKRLRRR